MLQIHHLAVKNVKKLKDCSLFLLICMLISIAYLTVAADEQPATTVSTALASESVTTVATVPTVSIATEAVTSSTEVLSSDCKLDELMLFIIVILILIVALLVIKMIV